MRSYWLFTCYRYVCGTVGIEQVAEAAKQISTLKAREDEQKKRRQSAEEEAEKIRKVRRVAAAAALQTMGDIKFKSVRTRRRLSSACANELHHNGVLVGS